MRGPTFLRSRSGPRLIREEKSPCSLDEIDKEAVLASLRRIVYNESVCGSTQVTVTCRDGEDPVEAGSRASQCSDVL